MKSTINKTKDSKIDFSKHQLVIHEECKMVVLVTGEFNIDSDNFKGVVLSVGDSLNEIGVYKDFFFKNSFKKLPSNQSVTLQND